MKNKKHKSKSLQLVKKSYTIIAKPSKPSFSKKMIEELMKVKND